MRWVRLVFVGAALAALGLSCSSSDSGGGGGNCPDVSGTWTLSGTCRDTSCTISQNGCNVTLNCSPTGTTYTGSVSGSSISFGDGSGTCNGNLATKTASGSCNEPGVGTCDWSASCQTGGCLAIGSTGGSTGSGGGVGSGGTPGSGGGTGVDCNASCATITGCCPGLSMSDCLTGCATQPNTSPACLACFNNTACGSLGPCVVANCGVPSEFCGDA